MPFIEVLTIDHSYWAVEDNQIITEAPTYYWLIWLFDSDSYYRYCICRVFLRRFRDPIELKIGTLESAKIIIGSLKSEKIGFLESDKSGPNRSIPGTYCIIFLKKNWWMRNFYILLSSWTTHYGNYIKSDRMKKYWSSGNKRLYGH